MGRRFQKKSGHLVLTVLLYVVAAAVSCEPLSDAVDENDLIREVPSAEKVTVKFRCDGPQTRSLLTVGDSRIRELMVYAFSDGILCGSAYDVGGSSVTMELPSHRKYNFYATANLGEGAEYTDEDELTGDCVYCGDWGDLPGIPMAASLHGVEIDAVDGPVYLDMERLAARFALCIDRQFSSGGFVVKEVQVKQEAVQIYPFCSGVRSGRYADGDAAAEADIASLNSGGEASFYISENLQGVLLPGNTDPWAKVPGNIPSNSSACTYLEISGEWSDGGKSAPLTYRLYLGEDNCTDFNIIRNTERKVTLSLTDEGVNASSWKVTKGSESDDRVLRFSPSSLVLIPDGRKCSASVQVEPSGIPYLIEYDTEEFEDADVTLSRSGDDVSLAAASNVPADRSLEVLLKTEDGIVKDVLDVTVRHVGLTAPYGVRIGEGQQCSIALDLQPSVSETGWTVGYRSGNEDVMSVRRESESDMEGSFVVNGASAGNTKLYAVYGPCEVEMDAIVECQDGFFYSGLPGYISGAAIQSAVVSPHLPDNLFSPIRLYSNSDDTVLKVTGTGVNESYAEEYAEYAPAYGHIYGASEFSIEPVGPGTSTLSFCSDYPWFVGQRMITVVPVSGYYLTASCRNCSTGEVDAKGPGNLPADFMFNASNGDCLDIVFAPEVKGAFIVSVKVSHLSRTVVHSGWTDSDYYSLSQEGAHLNDCVWHLTGRDCKVEMEVIFGSNQETVLSTFSFAGS